MKIERPNIDIQPFASKSKTEERTTFGSKEISDSLEKNLNNDFERGWGIVPVSELPTMQDFNAVGFTMSGLLAYLFQKGMAEYADKQTYYKNSLCVFEGNIYISKTDNNTGNALTDKNQWQSLQDVILLSNIVEQLGNSGDKVISQKACTDTFAKKISQEKLTAGRIEIKNDSDWVSLILTKADGNQVFLEASKVDRDAYFAYRDAKNNNRVIVSIPSSKDGTLALTSDVDAVNNFPVGAPIPWPHSNPPNGYLICNGTAFDKTKHPLLAQAYPAGRLPDLRAEFIRGWDADRKIDFKREILTEQAATSLRTAMLDYYNQDADGAWGVVGIGFKNEDSLFDVWQQDFKMPDSSNPNSHPGSFADNGMNASVKTAIKQGVSKAITVRPRNVAFLYIVRAV